MLLETISEDIKTAMKNKEKQKLDALRMLKARLIENKTAEKPIPELDAVISHAKKLKDSLELYPQGSEHATKIIEEISFLEPYMPKALSEEEVKNIILQIKAANAGANLGMVMKELTPQIKGRFDGKRASELVKSLVG